MSDPRSIHSEIVLGESQDEEPSPYPLVDDRRAEDVPGAYFMSQDDELLDIVQADPDLQHLRPLYSQLTRLTKIDTREKERWQNRIDLMIVKLIFKMKRKEYTSGRKVKLQSHSLFLRTVINDAHKGFKMTIFGRQRKEIVLSPEKRPSRWERFRGR